MASPSAPSVLTVLTRTRIPTTALLAAGALAATALLGGCGFETRQQAAAVVNGQVIDESDVRATANQLKAAKLTTKENIVVTGLIAAPLLKAAQGSGGSDPDETYARTISAVKNPTESTKAFVYAAVMLQEQKLSPAVEAKYQAAVKNATVSVNPKFGSFTPSAQGPVFFQLAETTPNWIKPVAPTPEASIPVTP